MSRPYEKAEEKEEAEEKGMCVFLSCGSFRLRREMHPSFLPRSLKQLLCNFYMFWSCCGVAIRRIHCALTSLNFNSLLVMPPPTSSASDIDHGITALRGEKLSL